MASTTPDALDPLHALLTNDIQRIDDIVRGLDNAIGRSTWMGPHRDSFYNDHYQPLRDDLMVLKGIFEDGDRTTLNLKKSLEDIAWYLAHLQQEISDWVKSEARALIHEIEHFIDDLFGAFEKVLGIDQYSLPGDGGVEWHTYVLPIANSKGFRPWVFPPE